MSDKSESKIVELCNGKMRPPEERDAFAEEMVAEAARVAQDMPRNIAGFVVVAMAAKAIPGEVPFCVAWKTRRDCPFPDVAFAGAVKEAITHAMTARDAALWEMVDRSVLEEVKTPDPPAAS